MDGETGQSIFPVRMILSGPETYWSMRPFSSIQMLPCHFHFFASKENRVTGIFLSPIVSGALCTSGLKSIFSTSLNSG